MDAPCIIVLSTSKNAAALRSGGIARLASTSATAAAAAPARAALDASFFVRRPIAASVRPPQSLHPGRFRDRGAELTSCMCSDHPTTQHRCADHQEESAATDERQVGTGVRQGTLLRVRHLDDLGRLLRGHGGGGAVAETDL